MKHGSILGAAGAFSDHAGILVGRRGSEPLLVVAECGRSGRAFGSHGSDWLHGIPRSILVSSWAPIEQATSASELQARGALQKENRHGIEYQESQRSPRIGRRGK